MNPIVRTFALVTIFILGSSLSLLKAGDEPSARPGTASASGSVAPTDVTSGNATREEKVPAVPASGPTEAGASHNDQPIQLEPLVISASTELSFQFSIRVTRSKPDNQLVTMIVDRVLPGSNAEEKGLQPGSMIISIDGKPISQFEASFRNGAELSKILVGRREGDEVTLVVIPPDETKARRLVITRRTRMKIRDW